MTACFASLVLTTLHSLIRQPLTEVPSSHIHIIVEQDISDEQKELNIYPKVFASAYKFYEVLLHLSDTIVL